MDADAKMTAIHVPAGIIAAVASFYVSNGSIPTLGENQAMGTFLGLVILLITGNIAERIIGKEEAGGFKGWLWSGIVPFLFIWFVVWAMLITSVTIT
ncbi:DUF5379 family protein [Methanothermobacter wolfeii]|uniref:DUF5379 family protein n=1 Tax=Methanothermobacter wolfeii TaxID=145261 RepID=A0A9E7RVG1_METWO|nr:MULTISPECIES: DUF5379 family protein [Methanothermobacter]MDI6841481.1 DUF5379 family protein [Methanothermobacter wolfeii]NLM01921.1 DUF5379 family protein [Methanothermobacter wolfeii]QHN05975.1 hypothetical protein FZP57_02085 [Methanothermobacter sp. THM-1]UXH32142.1 DUF5379 family protein [Methanothermobacter wolfeii]SCM56302.1 putative protein {ECO:0000313/EMBL:ADL58075,1} [Methanothermobacter wolfeii]